MRFLNMLTTVAEVGEGFDRVCKCTKPLKKAHACRSWRDLAGQHGSPMNCERCGEPGTAELPDDIVDSRVVGCLPDEPTQV